MTVSVSLQGNNSPAHDSFTESSVTNGTYTTHLGGDVIDGTDDGDDRVETIPHHPLGVKPSGNALTATWSLRASIGSFVILPDELILPLLEYLDAPSLLRFGRTCKALYAFTRSEELWKTFFIQ
jgi:hypothetical protein